VTDPDAVDGELLGRRLRAAGIEDLVEVRPTVGGQAALAGLAVRRDGPSLFAKTFDVAPGPDVFEAEAEGLRALRELGGADTPDVVLVSPDLLVLSALQPPPDGAAFWERLAHSVARLHTGTRSERFGWHRDNWLGRARQDNTWDDDGFTFFARSRVLRWLPEPRVQAAFDASELRAIERLCERLPELLPVRPACLTHGDFWAQNVLATADGGPALIDPAVSYMWADVDLAHLWCNPRPPESARFFDVYAEVTGLEAGWEQRMPLVQLRQQLTLVAQFDHDWGAADAIRELVAPFRTRR